MLRCFFSAKLGTLFEQNALGSGRYKRFQNGGFDYQ
jgi:hypothetical protein